MFSHHVDEMVERLIERKVISADREKAALVALRECWQDKIASVWTKDDILSVDDTLTDEQVESVLWRLLDQDASVGINWDSIAARISEVKEGTI